MPLALKGFSWEGGSQNEWGSQQLTAGMMMFALQFYGNFGLAGFSTGLCSLIVDCQQNDS